MADDTTPRPSFPDLDGSGDTPIADPLVTPAPGDVVGFDAPVAPMPTVASELETDALAPDGVPTEESPAKRGMAEGFSAMSEVRRARKEHANARDRLAKLQAEIDSDNQTLEHRRQVEDDYESIVTDQTAAIDRATSALEDLQNQITEADSKVRELTSQLEELKATHEKDIAPYKELADAARKRADGDQSAFNDARKAARVAEKHLKDLTKTRDSALDKAKRTIKAASDQMNQLNERLGALSSDPEANGAEIAKINAEIEAQATQREQATARLQTIPQETAGAIQTAQATLSSAREQLNSAKATADASKKEADGKVSEFKELRNRHRNEENELDDQITEVRKQIRGLTNTMASTQKSLEGAQAILQEAEAIHATPEETEQLANKVADNNAAASVQQQQVEALAQTEREVRARTRQSRVRLIVTLVIIAVVVIFIIWLLVGLSG